MPRVTPFRGLHYSPDRFASAPGAGGGGGRVALPDDARTPPVRLADVTDVVCPPYDVINDDQRRALLERHDCNAVRLEYSAEDDPHAAAAATLDAWVGDGTLERRPEPAAYYYRHATATAPDELTVEGIVVRVRLEPWGGDVRPHEHTMPGPKADRLALLRAARTQLSPILAIYFDRSPRYQHVMARAWGDEWRARDGDGLLHQLGAIEADDRLLGYLSRQILFIADGHHRYETALAYQAEVRSDPQWAGAPPGALGADWIMMLLVNAELSEVSILPTHRLILKADKGALASLARGDDLFSATPVPINALADMLEERRHDRAPTFGLILPGGLAVLLAAEEERIAQRLRREPISPAVRDLDLAALHVAVLDERLGIGSEDVAAGTRLAYTRSVAEARQRVASGEASAAILVRPTRIEQLADVANAGDVMPQKSTYFYPKLLTGMVFNPLEE